ncbi:IS1380 family transposase, partial [Enterobacter hormaechei]
MDHPEGAGLQRADRVDFDPRVRLEFRGTQLSSDGGLLVMRELDDGHCCKVSDEAAFC